MKQVKFIFISFLFVLFVFLNSCNEPIPPNTTGAVDKGERMLGIDISQTGAMEYHRGLELAKDGLKAEVIDLHFSWDMLEGDTEGDYSPMYNFSYLDPYYANYNVKVALTIAVIDTNALTVPSYLDDKPFDEMITSFNNLIDKLFDVFPKMLNNDVIALSIGNEIDVYLETSQDWQNWEQFYIQTSTYLKTINDQISLGSKITVNGILENYQTEAVSLNQQTDVVMLTYYPLNPDFTVKNYNVVHQDFETLAGIFTKDIYMMELGYPTSDVCLSNEELQALFFEETFKAWDDNKDQYKLMVFSWLADFSDEGVDAFDDQFEISDDAFLEYLRTLGFLTYDGFEKLSFNFIKEHAIARGW